MLDPELYSEEMANDLARAAGIGPEGFIFTIILPVIQNGYPTALGSQIYVIKVSDGTFRFSGSLEEIQHIKALHGY